MNPFDQIAAPSDAAGGGTFLGQSPNFWQSIAQFGGNLAAAANARTPGGFLAYGSGFGGPLGAATGATLQQQQDLARTRAGIGLQNAQAQNTAIDAALKRYQIPLLQQQFDLMQRLSSGELPGFGGLPSGGAPGGLASAAGSGAAIPPPQRQAMIQDAVKGTPIPSDLAYGLVDYESGWNPAARNKDSGAFGLGGTLPSTAQSPGFGMAPLAANASPQDQLKFAVNYLWQRGKAAGIQDSDWGDPGKVAAALTAYHGPQADANGVTGQQYAGNVEGRVRLASNGPAPMSGPAAAAAPAQQPGGGDYMRSPAYQQAMLAYRYSSVFGMSPLTRGLADLYKSIGDKNLELAMAGPVAGAQAGAKNAADLQYAGPIALQKAMNSNIDVRQGGEAGIAGPNGRTWIKNPQLEKVQNPDGSFSYVHVAPATPDQPPGTPGTASPVVMEGPNGTPLTSGATPGQGGVPLAAISPQQHEFLQERGKTLGEQFGKIDTDAAAARESNYLFDNLRNDSKTWEMGKFASIEGDARAYLSAIAHSFGIQPTGLDQKLADYQAFNKSSGMLLRSAVHETSSRAAVQEYQLIAETLPHPTTSQQGFGQIADQWQGLNDFRLAKQRYAQGYQGNPGDFNVDFNSKVSPTAFLLNRMSQTEQGQQDMQAMLARMQQSPSGRLTAKRMLQEYTYARDNSLFDGLPAPGGQ